MSDEGDNNFVRYIYRGEEDERIPLHATHVTVHEDVTSIPRGPFGSHDNIVEVICRDKVKGIERYGFDNCRSLRRVILPGVIIAEDFAFAYCEALEEVECGKLEIIGRNAFSCCTSLRSINLPSVEVVEEGAFSCCEALTDAKFGNKLGWIGGLAFFNCISLEQITIPLKHNFITEHNIFQCCESLKNVDLVEGVLHETIAALLLEEWRNDMDDEIEAINQILPHTNPGEGWEIDGVAGGKAQAIRRWTRLILRKIVHYKAEHQRLLNEAGNTLEFTLPAEIVRNNVLPFLALPLHAFEGEEQEEDADDI